MLMLRIAAYAVFALAGIAGILLVNEGEFWMLPSSISLTLTGIVLLAMDRGLILLAGIRDRLPVETRVPDAAKDELTSSVRPPRALSEIEADLVRLKSASQ